MGMRTSINKWCSCHFSAAFVLAVAPALCVAQHDFQRTWMAGGAFGFYMSADKEARVFASVGSGQGGFGGVKIGDPDGFWLSKTFMSPGMEYFEPHMMPDGSSFVADYAGGTRGIVMQRRRISDGAVLWEIEGLDGDAQLSLSADGRVGIVACQQNARVIDLQQGRILYAVGQGWYLTGRMAPDGSYFLWSQRGSTDVHVVQTVTGIETARIVNGSFPYQRTSVGLGVRDLDISPDGSKVAVALSNTLSLNNSVLTIIDVGTNRPVFVRSVSGSDLKLRFSPVGDRLLGFAKLSALSPYQPFVLSALTGQVQSTLDSGWEGVQSIVWGPEGDKVWLSGSVSQFSPFDRVAVYDPASGAELDEGRQHGFVGWPHGVVVRDGLVYSANQRVACRRLSDGQLVWSTTVLGAFMNGIALSPDGRVAVSIAGDRLLFFDTAGGRLIRKTQLSETVETQSGKIGHQVPSSPYMCIAGLDRIWIVDFDGHEVSAVDVGNCYSGVTSADGATCFVSRWKVGTGVLIEERRTDDLSVIRTLPGNSGDFVMSDDGSLVALLPWKHNAQEVASLEVRRASDWSLVMSEQTVGTQQYSSAAFSPDNNFLWVGFRQDYVGELRRYRIADGFVDTRVGSETSLAVQAIDVDTDGRTAAYLRDDGNIVVGTLTGD